MNNKMDSSVEQKLRILFDYQNFENNNELLKMKKQCEENCARILKEEELMGLHLELAAYLSIGIYDDIVHTGLVEFFAYCQSGRAGSNDGNCRLENLLRF